MALTGTPTNRTSIDLPVDVSNEIMQKTQEQSAVMRLAHPMTLPGRGAAINVITSDPEASWVGETNAKPISNPGLETKIMRAYKLAVIITFSREFERDVRALYDAILDRLPGALAKKFDATVFGNYSAPGSDFDTFANITKQSLASDAYAGLVAADTDVSLHGGIVNGYAVSPQMKGVLLGAEDTTHRPIFVNPTGGAITDIFGAPIVYSKGAFVSGSPATIGVCGDWSQALYGVVSGIEITRSDTATLVDGDTQINLWQDNMVGYRAEIEVGFRADTSVFNALTHNNVPSI